MKFKDLFKTIPENEYIKLNVQTDVGVTISYNFIKGTDDIDVNTYYDYTVDEVKPMITRGINPDATNDEMYKDIPTLFIVIKTDMRTLMELL